MFPKSPWKSIFQLLLPVKSISVHPDDLDAFFNNNNNTMKDSPRWLSK